MKEIRDFYQTTTFTNAEYDRIKEISKANSWSLAKTLHVLALAGLEKIAAERADQRRVEGGFTQIDPSYFEARA